MNGGLSDHAPLEGLTVRLADRDLATRVAGWWLGELGAAVRPAAGLVAGPDGWELHPVVDRQLDSALTALASGPGEPTAVTSAVITASGTAVDNSAGDGSRLDVQVSITSPSEQQGLAGDRVLWARSGLASLTRDLDPSAPGRPGVVSNGQASILAGTTAVVGLLAASLSKVLGGRPPQRVSVDKLETLAATPMQPRASAQLAPCAPGAAGGIPYPGGVFSTLDGPVYVRPVEPAHWIVLLRHVPGMDSVVAAIPDDPGVLGRERKAIDEALADWLAQQRRRDVVAELQAQHVPMASVQAPHEVLTDPHVVARTSLAGVEPGTLRPPWVVLARDDAFRLPPTGQGTPKRPLAGLRILDLTWAWAGPFATTLLADLGAEVLNIEWHPRPSNLRTQPPFAEGDHRSSNGSGWWSANQRGKRSIGVNLKHPEGRDVALRLAADCQIVVENFSPGVVERLGIGYRDVARARLGQSLVYVSMSAFGRGGPSAGWIGYGTQIFAAAGAALAMPTPTDTPSQMLIPYADPVSGYMGALGAMAYLWEAATHGSSVHLDVSELECMATVLMEPLLEAAADGTPRCHPYSWANDGRLVVDPLAEENLHQMATAVRDVLTDPYLHDRDFWSVDQASEMAGRDVLIGGPLWILDGCRPTLTRGAPNLFADTRWALAERLGMKDRQIDRLVEVGAVAESKPHGAVTKEGLS